MRTAVPVSIDFNVKSPASLATRCFNVRGPTFILFRVSRSNVPRNGNPRPSSTTSMLSSDPETESAALTAEALACLAALMIASWVR